MRGSIWCSWATKDDWDEIWTIRLPQTYPQEICSPHFAPQKWGKWRAKLPGDKMLGSESSRGESSWMKNLQADWAIKCITFVSMRPEYVSFTKQNFMINFPGIWKLWHRSWHCFLHPPLLTAFTWNAPVLWRSKVVGSARDMRVTPTHLRRRTRDRLWRRTRATATIVTSLCRLRPRTFTGWGQRLLRWLRGRRERARDRDGRSSSSCRRFVSLALIHA